MPKWCTPSATGVHCHLAACVELRAHFENCFWLVNKFDAIEQLDDNSALFIGDFIQLALTKKNNVYKWGFRIDTRGNSLGVFPQEPGSAVEETN